MAAVLSSVTDCCSPCSGTATVQVPGPPGDDGNDGDNGTNGVNAFTTLTAGFNMPAEGATVVASVANSSWAAINQLVYVQNAGWMRVTALPSSTQMTLRNEENTAAGEYTENVAPTTAVANGSKVSPGGLQGPAGAAGTGGMDTDAGNAVLPDARTNLGLLTAATFNEGTANGQIPSVDDAGGLTNGEAVFATANGVESQAAATARTSLGLAIGTNVQAYDAFLTDIATLGTAADRYIYTDGIDSAVEGVITAAGRALLDDATAAAQRATLGVLQGYGLLGSIIGWDVNSATTDTAFTIGSSRYIIDKITVDNASINLTTATGGVFTAAGGGGTTIAADQALSALTASSKFDDLTLQAIAGTDVFTAGTLYARCGTAQGAAATADIRVWGWKLD